MLSLHAVRRDFGSGVRFTDHELCFTMNTYQEIFTQCKASTERSGEQQLLEATTNSIHYKLVNTKQKTHENNSNKYQKHQGYRVNFKFYGEICNRNVGKLSGLG